jgi:predicted membrane protein
MNSRRVSPQLVLGTIVLLLGTAFFLDNLNIIDDWSLIRLWPAVIILIGLSKLTGARSATAMVGPGIWMFVGAWLLLGTLDIMDVDLRDLFPLAFAAFGGYLIWRAISPPERPMEALDSESKLSVFVMMGGVERKLNSAQFVGGDLTAVMGSVEVDLTQASIAGNEAVIDVVAVMAGVEIKIPRDWTASIKVLPLMGGAEDTTSPPAAPTKRLTIRGVAVMGGVEVKN